MTIRRPRPKHVIRGLVVLVGVVFGMVTVAQLSGSGWVQNVAFTFGGLAICVLCAPYFSLQRAKIKIISVPFDTTVGNSVLISLQSNTALVVSCYSKRKDLYSSKEIVVGKAGLLPVTFLKRGVFNEIELSLKTASPFGIFWWEKVVRAPMGHVIYVAPKMGNTVITHEIGLKEGNLDLTIASQSGLTKGIRDYIRGDLPINVHWRATAHSGKLMVREKERELGKAYLIEILPMSPNKVYEDALFSLSKLLSANSHVYLLTYESSGEIFKEIRSISQGARQLAMAL